MMKRTITKMGKTVTFRIACALDERAGRTGNKALSFLFDVFWRLSMIDWRAVGLLGLICAVWATVGIVIGAMYVKPYMGLVRTTTPDYSTTLQVTGIQEMGDGYLVTLCTATDITYFCMVPDGDICPGELYTVAMDDMGTPDDVRDDTVMSLRYTGF